jgi:hypothetical protein
MQSHESTKDTKRTGIEPPRCEGESGNGKGQSREEKDEGGRMKDEYVGKN